MYLIPLLLTRLANIWAHTLLRVREREIDTYSESIHSHIKGGKHKPTSIYIYRMFIKYKYEKKNIILQSLIQREKRERGETPYLRVVGMMDSVVPVSTLAVPVLP